MKKWLLMTSTFAALSLVNIPLAYSADDDHIEEVAAPKGPEIAKLREHVQELSASSKEAFNAARDEKTQLEVAMIDVNDKAEIASKKNTFFKNAGSAVDLLGQIAEVSQKTQSEHFKSLADLAGDGEQAPHADAVVKDATFLFRTLGNTVFEVPNASGKGMVDYHPFDQRAALLKVGQNIFVPGNRLSSINRKVVHVTYVYDAEKGLGYWSITNGMNGGRDRFSDETVVEDIENTNVITFDGTTRDPDGSTLIILPPPPTYNKAKEELFFTDLFSEKETTAQVNCNTTTPDFIISYAPSDIKSEEIKVRVPSSIMSGLKVLTEQAKQVEDIKSLAPIFTMIQQSFETLDNEIKIASEKLAKNIETYEKM